MMTIPEIRDHAAQLQGRLDAERRKVKAGVYGNTPANLNLISALQGRIDELNAQCDAVEAADVRLAV